MCFLQTPDQKMHYVLALPLLFSLVSLLLSVFLINVGCVSSDPDHIGGVHPDVRPGWEERNGRQGNSYFYGGREDESGCGQAATQGTVPATLCITLKISECNIF